MAEVFKEGEVAQKHKENRDTNLTAEPQGLSVLMTKLFSLYLNKWYHVDNIIPVPSTAIARKG